MHDTVAQKNFDPVLPPLPDDFEDELEEESVKIVRLVKNKEPLVSRDRREQVGLKHKSQQGEGLTRSFFKMMLFLVCPLGRHHQTG